MKLELQTSTSEFSYDQKFFSTLLRVCQYLCCLARDILQMKTFVLLFMVLELVKSFKKKKKSVKVYQKLTTKNTLITKKTGGYQHLFEAMRIEDLVRVSLQVSVAYLMCSPLQVLMKSWTWENRVSKSGMFGMENFTNLEEKCNTIAKV